MLLLSEKALTFQKAVGIAVPMKIADVKENLHVAH